MRKQAEQLVVGRVYADISNDKIQPVLLRFVGRDESENVKTVFVDGSRNIYDIGIKGQISFTPLCNLYELTPEEDAIYNKPSEPTFTLSDIQRVIERIENKANLITDNSDEYDTIWRRGMREAIKIMREELKIK